MRNVNARRYVTKYWQTKGILERSGELVDRERYFTYTEAGWGVWATAQEHWATYEEAKARVEYLREKKIKALEAQIRRIKNIKL